MFEPKWRTLTSMKALGGGKSIGIDIRIHHSHMPDLENDELVKNLKRVGYKAVDEIQAELERIVIASDPKSKIETENNRKLITQIFSGNNSPIFVEEIPNGYCNRYCCEHLPWFVVTTSIGRIKIGWRKRVIQIDWSDSICKITAEDLFPDEDVTKSGQMIHAWSIADAKRYVEELLPSTAINR